MTENEAIKKVKEFGLYHSIGDLPYSKLTVEAFEMAIKALEEIQQYRAIGTVDDIQSNAERKWIPVEEYLPEPNRDVLQRRRKGFSLDATADGIQVGRKGYNG